MDQPLVISESAAPGSSAFVHTISSSRCPQYHSELISMSGKTECASCSHRDHRSFNSSYPVEGKACNICKKLSHFTEKCWSTPFRSRNHSIHVHPPRQWTGQPHYRQHARCVAGQPTTLKQCLAEVAMVSYLHCNKISLMPAQLQCMGAVVIQNKNGIQQSIFHASWTFTTVE